MILSYNLKRITNGETNTLLQGKDQQNEWFDITIKINKTLFSFLLYPATIPHIMTNLPRLIPMLHLIYLCYLFLSCYVCYFRLSITQILTGQLTNHFSSGVICPNILKEEPQRSVRKHLQSNKGTYHI